MSVRKILPPLLFLLLCFPFSASAEEPADKVETRIVNGTLAPSGSWPSQAFVSTSGYYCGGTLIHPRWVLSAAHCFNAYSDKNDTVVSLGSHNRSQGTKYGISGIYAHSGYTDYFDNDISLLRLKSPAPFQAQKIARSGDEPYFSGGQEAFIAGWGTTCFQQCSGVTMLRQASVEMNTKSECADFYYQYIYTANMICAGGGELTADACQGDSGGPLEVEGPNGRLLVGIVSWGIGCADEDFPGVYTDISRYSNWIGSRIVESVQAPSRKRILGSASIQVSPKGALGLPISLRFRTSGPFRVQSSSCQKVPQSSTCSVSVKAIYRGKLAKGSLLIENYTGKTVAKVALRR